MNRNQRILSAAVTIFLVFAILGFINYLGFKNDYYVDLTHAKKYSLSDQTIKIVNSFQSPVVFKVFVGNNDRGPITALLNLFKFHNKNIEIDVIDPELKPQVVQKYGVTKYGTVVVEFDGRQAHVAKNDELGISNALLQVYRADTIIIYFTVGHGEVDLNLDTREGGSELLNQFKGMAYTVKPLDLIKSPAVPEDADALLILGPSEGFLEQELNAVANYLNNKSGKLFIAISPEFKTNKLKTLRELLTNWGIVLHMDVVVDRLSTLQGADPTVLFVEKYDEKHQITKNFKGRTVFPLSSSISKLKNSKRTFKMDTLVQSSNFPASWAESDLTAALAGKVIFDEKSDFKGPVAIMTASEEVVSEKPEKRVRIVCSGNASFFINGYSAQGPNFNLMLNAISWLVNEDMMISINRPQIEEGPIYISSTEMGVIFYFSVLFCPLILLALGIFIYKRRQKL